MFKKLLNIPAYLNLKDIGLLEMTFALTPMLSGFSLGSIPLSALMWVVLIMMVALYKGKLKFGKFMPLLVFAIYWAIHDFVMIFIDDANLNAIIVQCIYFAAVFIMFPVISFNKLRGSMNWVALITIGGLLYQWTIIAAGGGVHPLTIPGLTMSEGRLEVLSFRPSSFFMEPAAYTAFMMCPLALALLDKKWTWVIAIVLSIFLTTSTTGLVLSFILLTTTLFSNRTGKWSFVSIIILGVGLFYALNRFEIFGASVEKFENTDTETNVRLTQGPYVVSTMQTDEYILGAPYSSAYNYCKSGRAYDVVYYGKNVFLSTFWLLILGYGIVGLILYLHIYWKIYKISKITMPYVVCLIAVMFSSGYGIGGTYIFTLIFLLVIAKSDNPLILNNKLIR